MTEHQSHVRIQRSLSALATDFGDDAERAYRAREDDEAGHYSQNIQVAITGMVDKTDRVANDFAVAFRRPFVNYTSPSAGGGSVRYPHFGDSYELTDTTNTDDSPILDGDGNPVIAVVDLRCHVIEWLIDDSGLVKGAKVRAVAFGPDPNSFVPDTFKFAGRLHLTFTGYASAVADD